MGKLKVSEKIKRHQQRVYSLEEGKALMKKGKRKAVQHESKLQQACVTWFKGQHPQYANLLFAIPNGGKRSGVIGIMKAEGVLAGVPDLMLAVAKGKFHGLFIEMKIHPNKPSQEQMNFMNSVTNQGYKTELCYTEEEFKIAIAKYLLTL